MRWLLSGFLVGLWGCGGTGGVAPVGPAIYFASGPLSDRQIFRMPLDGGNPVQISHFSSALASCSVSEDGRHLVYCTRSAAGYTLFVSSPSLGSPHAIGFSASENFDQARLSADGTKVAWTAVDLSAPGASDVWVANADGTGARAVTTTHDADSPSFDTTGDRLAVRRPFKISVVTISSLNIADIVTSVSVGDVAWGGDGGTIVFSNNQHLSAVSPDGTNLRDMTLESDAGTDTQPWIAPDGQSVCFIADNRALTIDVFRVSINGTGMVRLTSSAEIESSLSIGQ